MIDSLSRAIGRPVGLFLLSCFCGLVAALGQAPFGLWFFTILGLALGYLIWSRVATTRLAAVSGWGLGTGYFALTLVWLVNPFLVEPEVHGWMAPFALIGMAAGLGLFWAFAAAATHWGLCKAGQGGWIAWPAWLFVAELFRGVIFTGFPWGGPGLVWIDTPIAQLAAWVGVSGLSFLTALLAAALVAVPQSASRVRDVGVLLVVVSLAVLIGLGRAGAQLPDTRPGIVRLIQPNAAQHLKWDPDHAPGFVQRQLDLTASAPVGLAPDLVIWPETSVPYLMGQSDGLFEVISDAARGASVVMGLQRGEALRYYNSLAHLDREGKVAAVYDKHHLVPFGEYVPFGDAFLKVGIGAFASQLGQGYSAGPGPALLDLGPLGKVLPLICYEAIFPRDIRNAPGRPDWMLQITNDAWFGSFSGPQQHFVQARFRAIEFGLPLVRVANTGISAVVDARGRVQTQLPLGQAGFLDAALPGALAETVYARFSDVPFSAFLLSLALVSLLSRRRKSH
ncbi:apolipoprotein N-acyltransferase [Aliiroseovarius sp. CAU 1755]